MSAGVLGAVAVLVRTIQFEIADVDSVDRGESTNPTVIRAHHSSRMAGTYLGYRCFNR